MRVKSHLWSEKLLYMCLYFNIELLKNIWKMPFVFFIWFPNFSSRMIWSWKLIVTRQWRCQSWKNCVPVTLQPHTNSEHPPQATVATTLAPLSPPWSLLTVESCLLCHHSTFHTWSLLLTLPMDYHGGCGALVVRHTFGASPPSPVQKKYPLDLMNAVSRWLHFRL